MILVLKVRLIIYSLLNDSLQVLESDREKPPAK